MKTSFLLSAFSIIGVYIFPCVVGQGLLDDIVLDDIVTGTVPPTTGAPTLPPLAKCHNVDISSVAITRPTPVFQGSLSIGKTSSTAWEGLTAEDWLDAHNAIRCRYGKNYLVWDYELEAAARQSAATATQENRERAKWRDLTSAPFPDGPSVESSLLDEFHLTARQVLEKWFGGIEKQGNQTWADSAWSQADVDKALGENAPWQAFLSVIWLDVASVGCAWVEQELINHFLYVCRYRTQSATIRVADPNYWKTQAKRIYWNPTRTQTCDASGSNCDYTYADEAACRVEAVDVRERWEKILQKYRTSFTSEVEAKTAFNGASASGILKRWVNSNLMFDGATPATASTESEVYKAFSDIVLREEIGISGDVFDIYFGRSQYIAAMTHEPHYWKTDPADWWPAVNEIRCRYVRRVAAWNYGLALSVQRYVDQRNFAIDSNSENLPHPDGPAYEVRYRSNYPIPPAVVVNRLFLQQEAKIQGMKAPYTIERVQLITAEKEPYVKDKIPVWTAFTWAAVKQVGCASSFDGKFHACRLWVGTTIDHPERVNNYENDPFARNVYAGFQTGNEECFEDSQTGYETWLKLIDLSAALFGCIEEVWNCWVAARDVGHSITTWCVETFEMSRRECETVEAMFGGRSGEVAPATFSGVLDDGLWEYPATPAPPPNLAWIEPNTRNAHRGDPLQTLGSPSDLLFENDDDDDESAAFTTLQFSSFFISSFVAILVTAGASGII